MIEAQLGGRTSHTPMKRKSQKYRYNLTSYLPLLV